MHVTIDERARLVQVSKGAVLFTLSFPHSTTRRQLEAAADGFRAALEHARFVVVNGELVQL